MTAAESARAGRSGREHRQGRRGQLQHPLLPAQPAPARLRRRRRAGRRPPGQRPLLPGLAADGDRLELAPRAGRGGALRAVGDIGSHWLDLTSFVTGLHVAEVMADLATFIPTPPAADRAGRDVLARARRGNGQARHPDRGRGDDPAALSTAARGASLAVSQISPGRKNSLQYEIDGSSAAAAWDSEQPDEMWIGHRDRPNEIAGTRRCADERRPARRGGTAGRPRRGLRRHVRRAFPSDLRRRRRRRDAPSGRRTPRSPTATRRCSSARPSRAAHARDAGSRSSASSWSACSRSTHETRLPDRALPRHAAHGGRRLGRRERVRHPRDRLLAAPPAAPSGATPARRTSTSPTWATHQAQRHPRRDRGQGPGHLRPRLLPQPAPSRPRPCATRPSPTSSTSSRRAGRWACRS